MNVLRMEGGVLPGFFFECHRGDYSSPEYTLCSPKWLDINFTKV
jgi:hypothetical protein